MASRLNPYFTFAGNAREAMDFYHAVLGGNLLMHTFGEYGAEGPEADGIMHAQLETEAGYTLMASDLPPGTTEAPTGSSITVSLSGDEGERLTGYFNKLAEGGTITMPLERQMWGDNFGQLVDKFGTSWMVNFNDGSEAPAEA